MKNKDIDKLHSDLERCIIRILGNIQYFSENYKNFNSNDLSRIYSEWLKISKDVELIRDHTHYWTEFYERSIQTRRQTKD